MPRTADIKLDDQNMSFLLIGENGTFKTRFFASIPFPVYIFDFDKGVSSLRGAPNIEYNVFKDAPAPRMRAAKMWTPRTNPDEGIYKFGQGWSAFLQKLGDIGESIDAGTCEFKVLGFDSYTSMGDLLMNHILAEDTKFPNKAGNPEIQHWNPFNRMMRNTIDMIVSWPLIKVVTAHVERAENPITGSMEQLPLANAKMQGMLPNFFDEVYFCDVTPKTVDGVKTLQPTLQSVRDGVRKNARSRWNVPTGTPTEWNALYKAIQLATAPTPK